MTPGTCKYCGCTETAPCEGGCAWADAEGTLCAICYGAETVAKKFLEVLGDVVASDRVRLIASAWTDLTPAHRQVLVMQCRSTVEMITLTLQESIDEHALVAEIELGTIIGFLRERLPQDEIRDGDTLSQVVIRLLEPHVGSRLVLAT